jgi:hypothetical protein
LSATEEQKLLEQYREAHATQRKLLDLFWKEPSVIVAIAIAVVLAAYLLITDGMVEGSIQYQTLRTFLVVFGALMAFASAQTAMKHTYRRKALLNRITEIETNLKMQPLQIHGDNKGWMKMDSAKIIIGSLFLLTAGFSVLSAGNIYYSAVVLEPYFQALSTTMNFWLEIVGLVSVFVGAILLTLTEIPKSLKAYVGGKVQLQAAQQKSKSAILATIIIAVGFLLELIGMAIG